MIHNNSISDCWIANLDCHQLGENISFVNNTIMGGNRGIRWGAYSGTITGNNFIDIPSDYGVYLDVGAVTIDGLTISGNTFTGCYVGVKGSTGNNVTITGNTFANSVAYGIDLNSGVNYNMIVGNQFHVYGTGAYRDNGTGNTWEHNQSTA
jgi:hypothetical protein